MKVLVATDGSEHSMKAVQRGLELAEKQGAQVTLMSVAYYVQGNFDGMPLNIQDKLEDEAREALKKGKALFDAKNLPVETVTGGGAGAGQLNHRQRPRMASLTASSSAAPARTPWRGYSWAAPPAKVVAHAPCEVTVVR